MMAPPATKSEWQRANKKTLRLCVKKGLPK
jgi:hypothetical protein